MKKVVHLCLACFFPDGYSYQENMLPKFHKELGYDVKVIASLFTFDEHGKGTFLKNASTYINEHGIQVTRLNYKTPVKLWKTFRRFENFKETLENAAPDIIFIHGCQFKDIDIVASYAKNHPGVEIFVDNHADFSNSATNFFSKKILHGIVWKSCAKKINPYTKKFYGVLPARVDFLKNVYKLPPKKCELLVMGADDDMVEKAKAPEVIKQTRDKYSVAEDDFLIMTGGKIDAFKTQTLLLMQAVLDIPGPKVKLIVFGSVTQELKDRVEALANGTKVQYIGWVQSQDSYPLFAAADLVVFPGRHSVFWEQVAAQGIPMLCKEWDGTTHVKLGDNVTFLTKDSAEEIKNEIEKLCTFSEKYKQMKDSAQEGMKVFSYRNIASRSIK